MTDEQALFALLAAVYLFECVIWMRREGVAFRRGWTPSAKIVAGTHLPGTARWGAFFSSILPPLRGTLVTQLGPLSASPEGVLGCVSQAFNPGARPPRGTRYVSFDAIRPVVASGRAVLVGGERFVEACSEPMARHVAELLERLGGLDRPAREKALRTEMKRLVDTRSIQDRVDALRRAARPLRWAACALFLHLFVLCPAVVVVRGLSGTWVVLLAVMLVLHASVVASFWIAHRTLYPGDGASRWASAIAMALLPPASLRAEDLLARDLLATFHPLGAARLLCGAAEFEEVASQVLRDLRHPIEPACPVDEPSSVSAEAWHRAAMLRELEAFAARALGGRKLADGAPGRESPACRAYCPRCLAQYTTPEATCGDCGGLALVLFSGEPPMEGVPLGSPV
jgi:hypothetical protein